MRKKINNYSTLLFLTLAFVLIIFISSCGEEEEVYRKPELTPEQQDSVKRAEALSKLDTFQKIAYNRIVIRDRNHWEEIKAKYASSTKTGEKFKALKTLNRKELGFFRVGDTIIVPNIIFDDMRAYSVFPILYWEARDIPKIIMVSNKLQCYGCYEYGKLVRFAAANTGKERTPSFPGRYALEWKDPLRLSSLDSNWKMPNTWNFHAEAGSAFHKFTMPGRPVSHSCIRQLMDDSKWLFGWGRGFKRDSMKRRIPMSGTPVIIIDIFDFARKRYGPWIDLSSNKDSILTLPKKPMEVEEALIPWCQIPDDSKGVIRNRWRYIHAEDTLRARGIIRPHVKLIQTVNFNKIRREKAAKAEKLKKEKELKEKLLLEQQQSTIPETQNINGNKNNSIKTPVNKQENKEKKEGEAAPPPK